MMFGYCETGAHESQDPETKGCPGEYQPFYFGTAGKDRNKLIEYGDLRLCACRCHGRVGTSTKRAGRRRKK